MLLNNIFESFNAIIIHARSKKILGMLESIRTYLMINHEIKREGAKKHEGLLCLKILKYVNKLNKQSTAFTPRGPFQV